MQNNKYAFLMIEYETPSFITDIHSQLFDEDLYKEGDDSGIEKEAHVTLVPCLDNNVNLEDLKQHLLPLEKYKVLLNNISTFENELYDVLKCDVQSDFLHQTNSLITSKYPTYSEFKEYHPHLTIAYLNKGGVCDKFKQDVLSPLVILKPKCFNFSFYNNNNERENIRFI